MFPIHARCVTFEAGYPAQQAKAMEELKLGKVYTIRHMEVGQSETTLEFYGVPGHWNSCFFAAVDDDDLERLVNEDYA